MQQRRRGGKSAGGPSDSNLRFLSTQHYVLSELALDARGGLYGLHATQNLDLAAVEYQDDDYYDVLSGEESDARSVSSLAAVCARDPPAELEFMHTLTRQVALKRIQNSLSDSLYAGAMDHYRPERSANPLRNAETRKVFAHFISTTAPMLSPYERPIKFSPSYRAKTNLPPTPLSLWTFTLPMRALHHQGLLHAMLAMSSLHIARLDSASVTPSYKHYSWSIKKIHKQVSRQTPGTVDIEILAATLLLSFYEVMTADLHKWLPHLCGARQLLSEIDFPGMSRQLHRMKQTKQRKKSRSENQTPEQAQEKAILHRFQSVDPKNVDFVMGKKRFRDKFGWPLEIDDPDPPPDKEYSLLELSAFEVLQDMWWWYVKQDGIFSYLSADPPMMDYKFWSRCPPRCELGKINCVYGAYDWAILALGRASDFAARDIARKVRQNEFNGNRFPAAPFFGLGPSAARTMPTAYGSVLPQRPPAPPLLTREELNAATAEALKEWQEIKLAIDLVESKLEAAYPPLTEDQIEHWDTPFGRSIRYECDNIAGMLLNVKMARLQHARTHPYMPPSIIMAIAAAAHQTKDLVQTMGRIMAGISVSMSCIMSNDPAWAGAFADCCLPLYAAGLQVTNPAQRDFVITRLYEIEAKSGNASAGLCAAGCESSWERAGLEGRGPVYVKRRADMEARKRLYRRLDGAEGDPREMRVPLVYRAGQ